MSLKGAGNGLLSSLTVYELLLRGAEVEPNSPAITYIEDADTLSTVRLTRGQFITRLHQMIRLFRELGVERSDVISILSPNVPDAMIAFFAAETVGIVNPINFLLRPEEVVAMVQTVKSKVLITIGPEAPDLWKTAEYIKARAPLLEHIVTIGGAAGEAISFLGALEGYSSEAPLASELPAADDIAAYFHTGGTTGSPKVALHTHRNQVFSAEALANSWEFDSSTRALNGLPIFHVAGSLFRCACAVDRGSFGDDQPDAAFRAAAIVGRDILTGGPVRTGGAASLGQKISAAQVGRSANVLFDLCKLRIIGRDDDIASECDFERCCEAKPLNGADDRDVQGFQPGADPNPPAQHLTGALAVDTNEGGLHIHAAAEMIARGLDQQRADVGRLNLVEYSLESRKQGVIGEIDRRIIDGDDANICLFFEAH